MSSTNIALVGKNEQLGYSHNFASILPLASLMYCMEREDIVERRFLDTIGKRLRALRVHKDLNQDELSREIERTQGVPISQNYISQLEKDKKKPGAVVALALAKFFNTSLDYLLLASDIPQPVGGNGLALSIQDDGRRERAREALEELSELTDEEIDNVIDGLQLLVDMSKYRRVDAIAVMRTLRTTENQQQREWEIDVEFNDHLLNVLTAIVGEEEVERIAVERRAALKRNPPQQRRRLNGDT